MKAFLKSIYTHFVDFAYPTICVACEKQTTENESAICFDCLWSLPRTESHSLVENELEKRFWGKVNIAGVYSFLKFSKRGKVQNILHALKYRNSPELAVFLGRIYGKELYSVFLQKDIDLLIPIPLHRDRLKERGFNQSECFANGLSESLGIPVTTDILVRSKAAISQTKTGGRLSRFNNLKDAFSLVIENKVIKGKNVILVDDVLTTGATIEVAGSLLLENGVKNLYIITLAAA